MHFKFLVLQKGQKENVNKVFKEILAWKFGQNYPELRFESVLEGHVEFQQFRGWSIPDIERAKEWREWSLDSGKLDFLDKPHCNRTH